MCGICGRINFDSTDISLESLKKMADGLRHRGPDGEGFYLNKNRRVGFGHRRLAIIDLKTGEQPMSNEDRSLWIVFNGEIYNFQDLRGDLEKKGHHFRTKSDTEVILHSYEEYGNSCVKLFNGMFSFAIWDEKKQTFFLARDRMGEKPLFYIKTKNAFLFASEVKALLCDSEVKKEIDLESLGIYLSLGYFLSPFSIIKNIKKLPPATFLTMKNSQIQTQKYWDLDPSQKLDLSEDDCQERFLALLEDSVRARLTSDVPLGSFLSGGIDSTTIVSYMRKLSASKPKTFSIGFKDQSYNELDYSREASDFLETEHHALMVEPDVQTILPEIVSANDEPLADNSAIPMFFLSQMTRKRVKVALSGDGGDENLAGYETYIADKLFPYFKKLPFKNLLAFLIGALPTSFNKVSFDYKLKQFVKAKSFSLEKAHYSWREIFSEEEKKLLLDPDIYKKIEYPDTFEYFRQYFEKYPNAEFLDKALYTDMKTWLIDDVLTKVDRASMGNSLEVRVPFLDFHLIEFLAKVPTHLKLRGFQTKYLLKKSMRGKIPKKIIWRKKEGFNAPVSMWLRKELKSLVLEKLSDRSLKKTGCFDHRFVNGLVNDYFAGRKDNSYKIWVLLNFIMWKEKVLNNE